jgi:tRNA(Ile)-lysidine synthase
MIRDQVLATIRRHDLFEPGVGVVVAVSGGPDSVALLHLLLDLRSELGLRLSVAHLDHGLRGEASGADRAFVAELARAPELPFTASAVDVAALAKAERRSPEDAGRAARRRFLREVAQKTGSRRVALGHTSTIRRRRC